MTKPGAIPIEHVAVRTKEGAFKPLFTLTPRHSLEQSNGLFYRPAPDALHELLSQGSPELFVSTPDWMIDAPETPLRVEFRNIDLTSLSPSELLPALVALTLADRTAWCAFLIQTDRRWIVDGCDKPAQFALAKMRAIAGVDILLAFGAYSFICAIPVLFEDRRGQIEVEIRGALNRAVAIMRANRW